jgi:hypothetical protein
LKPTVTARTETPCGGAAMGSMITEDERVQRKLVV